MGFRPSSDPRKLQNIFYSPSMSYTIGFAEAVTVMQEQSKKVETAMVKINIEQFKKNLQVLGEVAEKSFQQYGDLRAMKNLRKYSPVYCPMCGDQLIYQETGFLCQEQGVWYDVVFDNSGLTIKTVQKP